MINMRLPKFSLKKCFALTVGFTIIVIFGVSLRYKDIWKSKIHNTDTSNEKAAPPISSNDSNDIPATVHSRNLNQRETPATPKVTSTPTNPVQDYIDDNQINSNIQPIDSYDQDASVKAKPWYLSGGRRYPKPAKEARRSHKRVAKLLPFEDPWSDRITNQLMFVPPNYEEILESRKLKTILLYNGIGAWNVKEGREIFTKAKCPVSTCRVTSKREVANKADLILYKDYFVPTGVPRPPNQMFMMYFLECPYHTQHVKFPDAFNWTATYRKDSTIVAPYEKWEYYDPRVKQMEQDRNFAQNKTKKVAWFVSNCGARNGRLNYAHELQKYIDVDIYGSCGSFKCSRTNPDKCFEMLNRNYKFYLAFENSNCKDYITEKFFVNALNRNILPIVMGARPEDYEASAPYRSYIHVDEFASPKELAEYLTILDKNDDLYNSYFKWKGTGEFINTYFWCRVCAMLHDDYAITSSSYYEDINEWWRGPGTCTNGSWRNFQARKKIMSDDD